MKIILNEDEKVVKETKNKIKDNNGYCPCALEKTKDTKCICKNFRDKFKMKILGECHCGLYKIVEE